MNGGPLVRRAAPPCVVLLVFLAACGDEQAAKNAKAHEPDSGRTETRKVLAADAVGYDGQAIRKNLDGMLDENDKRAKELAEAQGATAPPAEP